MKLSNQPPKGTRDWLPKEFAIRKYIFETWRSTCLKFGYQEYLTPIVESAEVYRAKSGEDVGGSELMSFFDRGERELAIRPEMTPSVTRMVTQFYESDPKPIRLFSIANFFRNEKPQKGRNREFWQLNADIFGSDSLNADIEIASLAIEIMIAFGAKEEQFIILVNDRRAIVDFVKTYLKTPEDKIEVSIRILDKFWKLSNQEFIARLISESNATIENPVELIGFMKGDESARSKVLKQFEDNAEWSDLQNYLTKVSELGYSKYVKFDPAMVRGLDYYDGIVFEVYDYRLYLKRLGISTSEPSVERSLFGGGRYNGLASIFGSNSFPAVGFAPGDETTKLFLESWDLIPKNLKIETYYFPLLGDNLNLDLNYLAKKLRFESKNIVQGLEVQKLNKAFEYANKINSDFVVIFGEDEKTKGEYQIKNLKTGEQRSFSL